MSSNAPQQPQDDPWVPRRVHGGLRPVRRVGRGKSRHYEFMGQLPGETVKMVIRKHKFFLIAPAFPFVGSILALIIVFGLGSSFPVAGPLWSLLEVLLGALVLGTGIYFAYNDLALWWLETNIITDRRILTWKGLLNPSRQETPIERVTQMAVDQRSILSMLLSYGDLHLYLVGGKGLQLNKIPNPKKVRDSLQEITNEAKQTTKAAPSKPAVFSDPDLTEVLAKLAKGEEVPTLPNPDEKYAHRQRSDRLRGPLRTFGGPLRLLCDVTYISGENTVMYIQRSRYVLVGKLILPVVLLVAAIIASFIIHTIFPYTAIAILVILVAMGLIVINYVDDVYILTNRRIIEIQRKFIFFYEEHDTTEYSQIKDIKVKVRNIIELNLDIGNVIVETPGNNPDIIFSLVDHPFSLQDIIYSIKGFKEKVDKAKATNDRKNELNQWFGEVLTVLEQKMLGRGVPNLQKLDLWTAAQRAREFGMKVVPVGEDSSFPNIEPGLIVDQNPIPGTLVQVDSENPEERPQIRVILSRRP